MRICVRRLRRMKHLQRSRKPNSSPCRQKQTCALFPVLREAQRGGANRPLCESDFRPKRTKPHLTRHHKRREAQSSATEKRRVRFTQSDSCRWNDGWQAAHARRFGCIFARDAPQQKGQSGWLGGRRVWGVVGVRRARARMRLSETWPSFCPKRNGCCVLDCSGI